MFSAQNKNATVINTGVASTSPNAATYNFTKTTQQAPLSNSQTPPPMRGTELPPMISNHSQNARKRFILFLVPILILVGTMAALTWIIPSLRTQSPQPVVTNPEPTLLPATPAPTASPDPLKGWKAYTNRDAELSFKFPPEVSLKDEKSSDGTVAITLTETATSSAVFAKIVSSQKLDPDELTKAYVGNGTDVIQSTDEDFEISGVVGKRGSFVVASGGEGTPVDYAYIQRENTSFLFVNFLPSQKATFETFISSVRLVSRGITADWQTHTSTFGSYSVRYPAEWSLNGSDPVATGSSATISIRKNPSEAQFQNVVIEASVPSAKQKIELTAGEIISSIQNLSGWSESPTLDFRTLGGGQAQIISGQKDGAWHIYVVLWYRNTLIQITWRDTLMRPEQETFDDILGSFKFR